MRYHVVKFYSVFGLPLVDRIRGPNTLYHRNDSDWGRISPQMKDLLYRTWANEGSHPTPHLIFYYY